MAGRHLPGGHPTLGQGLLIVACMVFARSAAMTFNRLADATIDARNPRTATRPLPVGRISARAAWSFWIACCALFVVSCCGFWWLYGNRWPAALAIPVLMLLCGYSYTKRFTHHSHFLLGAAIGLSPVAAWLAIHPPSIGWPVLALMAAVSFWIGGFDIIYACQDIEVDRREALYSLPARLGPAGALWIARAAHVLTVVFLLILWRVGGLGTLYLVGVASVALLLLIENSLVRAGDLSRVNLAFFTVNGVIGVLLGVAAVTDILLTAY
jgi:4-hydroxybenzoate polyprenyltransferase